MVFSLVCFEVSDPLQSCLWKRMTPVSDDFSAADNADVRCSLGEPVAYRLRESPPCARRVVESRQLSGISKRGSGGADSHRYGSLVPVAHYVNQRHGVFVVQAGQPTDSTSACCSTVRVADSSLSGG